MEVPPDANGRVLDALDRQSAAFIESLRKLLAQKIGDLWRAECWRSHELPRGAKKFDNSLLAGGSGASMVQDLRSRPYRARSSCLAFSSFCLRVLGSPLPPRLMKKVSIDIAERSGSALRR